MLPKLENYEIWFVTGSQHLYGPETLQQVAEHSQQVAAGLGESSQIPTKVVFKPVVKTAEEIRQVILEANANDKCVGIVAWMHTFSPAKMWVNGLNLLQKPLLHLHTQFSREIPWGTIDMDFMNLNQSAHGGREFGFINARLRIARKVVTGHWQDEEVQLGIGTWARAACARQDLRTARFARFGDNMRDVSVTEGDKVAAESVLGCSVNGYGVGDLVCHIDAVTDAQAEELCETYAKEYELGSTLVAGGSQRQSLVDAAKIELGLRSFLTEGGFAGYTNTFEDLRGMKQLPGIATQRLMADGYGFGAEGDWKAAIMVRAAKVMAQGLPGGTSFMEDYTYHFPANGEDRVLGSHMLEICPTIASDKPTCEVHPLGIGGKEDPVRLVFNTPTGPAVNATIIDMGNRFRFVVNTVDVVQPDAPLEKLPVARALWKPMPNLKVAATAWIYAGGSHHPVFSQALTMEHFEDFAEMLDVELVAIDEDTKLRDFKQQLRVNDSAY